MSRKGESNNFLYYVIGGAFLLLFLGTVFFWNRTLFDFSTTIDDNLLGNFATFWIALLTTIALFVTAKDYWNRRKENRPYFLLFDKSFYSRDTRKLEPMEGIYELPEFLDSELKPLKPYVGIYNAGNTNALNIEIKWTYNSKKVYNLVKSKYPIIEEPSELDKKEEVGLIVADREWFLFLPKLFMQQYGEKLNNDIVTIGEKGNTSEDEDDKKEKLWVELMYSDFKGSKYSQKFEFIVKSNFVRKVDIKVKEIK